jgi:hypothetical protein
MSELIEYICKCGSKEFECVEKIERTCYLVAKADDEGLLTFKLDKDIDPNPDGDCGAFVRGDIKCSKCGEVVDDGAIDDYDGWETFED